MNKNQIKNTMEESAKNEGNIGEQELLQEIQPLLKEYFIGRFGIEENAIIINFLNGQKFSLTVKKVKS